MSPPIRDHSYDKVFRQHSETVRKSVKKEEENFSLNLAQEVSKLSERQCVARRKLGGALLQLGNSDGIGEQETKVFI